MKNVATKLCIAILILTFIAMCIGVFFTALDDSAASGLVTGIATALCALGWFLAMRNFRLAEEGDFSSERKRSALSEKLLGQSAKDDITIIENTGEIPESERL